MDIIIAFQQPPKINLNFNSDENIIEVILENPSEINLEFTNVHVGEKGEGIDTFDIDLALLYQISKL